MDTIPLRILPALRAAGVPDDAIDGLLVRNPRRLLEVAT
jgi:predicted metal-dependent phosphotriesterase family hydrolase